MMVGLPDSNICVEYNKAPSDVKLAYQLMLKNNLELKYWNKLETRQYWSMCSCRIFHERFYKKTIRHYYVNDDGESVWEDWIVTVDRSIYDHDSKPERFVWIAGVVDKETGEEIYKPIPNWKKEWM